MPVKLLLCTDLDRTLLPNGPEPESPSARQRFNQLVVHPGVVLAYVTGRDQGLVEEAIEEYQLPHPDYVIANVGSSIYELQQDEWLHWEKWQKEISADWQGETHEEMRLLFNKIPSLTLQQEAKQSRYKLSYYVPIETDHEALTSEIQEILDRRAIRANLIWSIDEIAAMGLLDVLPESASKSHAIEFLMQQIGYDLSNTIFAGDSGNDLAVMCSPIKSILVANASDEVCHQAAQRVSDIGLGESLFHAEGGFLGMNGNYSSGILEGIAHFMPETINLIDGLNESSG